MTRGPLPAAVAEVRRAVRPYVGQPCWVACSGGADSVALAAAVAVERGSVPAGLVSVDHGLQDGSAAIAEAVAGLGRRLGFDPVRVERVDVGADGGPEAAARRSRYAALAGLADSSGWPVLLGHTRDDQAETVLLGLGRGSGPRSIAGMRPVDGWRVRPLLDVGRDTTRQACTAQELPVWDDPHNADPRFRRVRVRHELIPLMDDVLGGGVVAALARTGDLLRDDLEALDALAASELRARQDGTTLDPEGLDAVPLAVRSRVLRAWIGTGAALTAVHLRAVDRLVSDWRGQDHIDLPGARRVVRRSGRLVLEHRPEPPHD